MDVTIYSEHITLAQFLKKVNLISTGGEARFFLSETIVLINGEPDARRGRKLRPGDVVKVGRMTYDIKGKP